jgi:6-phosphofructokinase 2
LTNFTRIAGETRTNIILKEQDTGIQYGISASGPEISAGEIGQIYQSILNINDMTYLVLSGSLPKGVSPNLYGQLILAGKKNGSFIVLDTDGKALKESIEFLPSCIKPNGHELSRLVGKELESESSILLACAEIHEKGVPYVLVSRGKQGLILSTREKKIRAVAPPVEVDSTVGAGDSAVAGFVLAHSQGKDLMDSLRLACAAGTATAKTPGTELCNREEVEKILAQVEISVL